MGTYNLKGGRLQVEYESIGLQGTGVFNQSGGQNTVVGTLGLGINFGGSGTYNLSGGKLSAGNISIQVGGGTGTFNVMNTITTVTGDVENNGTVNTTKAIVTWNGTFTNKGAYISDHATQIFTDLTVGRGASIPDVGYLVGHSQDVFKIKNDFKPQYPDAANWDTAAATLQFITGADKSHDFYIPGADKGPSGTNGFEWGTLIILGQTVHLFDGNDSNDGTAQYVGGLIGAQVNWFTKVVYNICNGDDEEINIYYDPDLLINAYLLGKTYDFAEGLGQLKPDPTPVPPSVLLLGSGLLGLGLLGWRRKRG